MEHAARGTNRREFLTAAGVGAAGALAFGGLASGRLGELVSDARAATTTLALAATDGYITVPGREDDPIYIFGFIPVSTSLTVSQLEDQYKGHAQHTAPTLNFLQNDNIKVTLTNLGLIQRPDLTDSHTIHWHGFDIPSPLNDGVPEVSVAVPIGQQLTYFYRPHREGTYMYHCHFEDVEHVQMGMTGIVFVRPLQDNNAGLRNVGTTRGPGAPAFKGFAYNDGDASTGYDRHFAILLNEVWAKQHDGDRDIQETIPTDFDPDWFTLNGRCFPETLRPNDDPTLTTLNPTTGSDDHSQPNSALIQLNPGDRALLRLANLGYTTDSMELPGIAMHVVGQDASLLRDGSVDTSYVTDTIFMGPGEARDVLFDAPAFDAALPTGSDGRGAYNVYQFKNRDWRKLSNGGAAGPGGMQTEVRVYRGNTLLGDHSLPAQNAVSETYV